MRAIHDGHNYRKHELVARDLEREFGHERVQGAHIERDGKARPERTPSHKEQQQAERTGISAKQAKEHITGIWRATHYGWDFAEALKHSGWILAKGDRRDFVVIDPRGGTHSLARRIEGAKAADVRARLSDINRSRLPSVAEARDLQRTGQKQRATERGKAPPRAAERAATAPTAREAPRARAGGGAARVAGGIADALFRLVTMETAPPAPRAKDAKGKEAGKGSDGASPQAREEEERSKHRQELLRDYGREIPEGTERDAAIERDRRDRDRGRERER